MSAVKDQQREAVRRMWAEYSSGYIAEQLGITRGAVMGHVHRLKKAGLLASKNPDKVKETLRSVISPPLPRPKLVPPHKPVIRSTPYDPRMSSAEKLDVTASPASLQDPRGQSHPPLAPPGVSLSENQDVKAPAYPVPGIEGERPGVVLRIPDGQADDPGDEGADAGSIEATSFPANVRSAHRRLPSKPAVRRQAPIGLYRRSVRPVVLGANVTADLCGDPPPGRSALNNR